MLSPQFLGGISDDVKTPFEVIVRDLVAAGALGDTVVSRPEWQLPDTLRASLATVVAPPDPAVGFRVVSGLFDSFDDLGPTPSHWSADDRHRTAPFDVALALAATALGTVFGWMDQQEGRLVHNILPSKGFEHMQVGASSTVPLAWHSEDGFHPERADFLLLACVRNPDHIGSRLVSIRGLDLDPADIAQLRRPLLTIEPDDSYEDDTASTLEPVGMSTVWDGPDGLCVRYDPSYTRYLTDDEEFIAAHHRLGMAFEEQGAVVPLSPGDLLIIDNDAVVHGRVAFRPRYDGTDRWLKRVLIRASRGNRPTAERQEHGYHQQRVFASR